MSYPYHDYIKTPDELKVSSKGNLTTLGDDIAALGDYVNVLVSGHTNGQKVAPLGNKYFMDTGNSCTATDGSTQDRYVFVNNIPSGRVPFISSAMGVDMTQFEGLVPGVLEDLGSLDPSSLFSAFDTDTPCQKITMAVRDASNNEGTESKYVVQTDISKYDACWFPNKKNPVTNAACTETFQTKKFKTYNDPLFNGYVFGIGVLGSYILWRTLHKN
jgi:hypothetical protein